eukprot:COSAG01_NODE_768_length_13739_cov_6.271334_22_plen_60_part_00
MGWVARVACLVAAAIPVDSCILDCHHATTSSSQHAEIKGAQEEIKASLSEQLGELLFTL